MIELHTTFTCPDCRHGTREVMPEVERLLIYTCKSCGVMLRPLKGGCCVFCSYGDIPCPEKQGSQGAAC